MSITFANIHLLWLLLGIIPLVAYYIYRQRQGGATLGTSNSTELEAMPKTLRQRLRHLPFVLRMLTYTLAIVALARPQSSSTVSSSKTEGIDIVLSLDISGSMLARDFEPNRISAVKSIAAEFINSRPNDRIGLVVFAGESYTQSPLTTDKSTLTNLLSQVENGIITDGTAIGEGLATAINRLKDSQAKSKVIILLTDGVNNAGQIAPLTAASIASSYDIKVYTIGVGTEGEAPYPAMDPWGRISYVPMKVEIDEQTLSDISEQTDGEYFRAKDNKSLLEIYKRIDALERSEIEVSNRVLREELFVPLLLMALALMAAEFLTKHLWFKNF
ncbi:MAG: VWA domain-containing protein [Rikenellaceae bacterium]